ncbi:hypothetical protein EXIGLDRAFT_830930 [Exidia glandulosa HHB12029]|uniref:Uncharacterized protein n=1 Tax=Exidia glandulosa HHB12029 TaxID=1314781 RepID=A0A165N6B6_EXIGL|nr:hypothetical protein EXIGLDRAFT_830930 [Exidia glandulosa HHB12029]
MHTSTLKFLALLTTAVAAMAMPVPPDYQASAPAAYNDPTSTTSATASPTPNGPTKRALLLAAEPSSTTSVYPTPTPGTAYEAVQSADAHSYPATSRPMKQADKISQRARLGAANQEFTEAFNDMLYPMMGHKDAEERAVSKYIHVATEDGPATYSLSPRFEDGEMADIFEVLKNLTSEPEDTDDETVHTE